MAKRYITQGMQKKNTLADIFIMILEKKQTTRREIEFETGFSWGTVSANVAFLMEKGYVTEEKSEQSGVGRTTYTVRPGATRFAAIGLDLNRSGISCEVIGLDALVRQSLREDFRASTQAEVIAQAEALCRRALAWCEEHALTPFSLGIAMQGAVDGRAGLSLRFPAIRDWQVCNVKEHFSKKFRLPVYLGHDPKCMLLGEMHRERQENSLLLRIDDGIGMAVSLDGRILDDTERLELGHTVAVPDGARCGCGRRGCLEAYAAIPAIAARDGVGAEELFTAPLHHAASIAEAGRMMSTALYNMYVLFKPRRLILTGKATQLAGYAESAIASLAEEEVEIIVNPHVSAAYGAAVESMKSAIKAFAI